MDNVKVEKKASEPEPEKPIMTDKPEQHLLTVKAPSDADTLQDDMEISDSAGSALAGKRPRDIVGEDFTTSGDVGREEPPAKIIGMRRPTLKPRPNLQTNPRAEARQPLQKLPGT
ncbi:hypothetical protein MRX96_004573 [Rhipicephalus microplus]